MLHFILTFELLDAGGSSNPFGTAMPLRDLLDVYITDNSACLLDLPESDVIMAFKKG